MEHPNARPGMLYRGYYLVANDWVAMTEDLPLTDVLIAAKAYFAFGYVAHIQAVPPEAQHARNN